MTELGLRPRSATELVDAAFQVFRRDPIPFMAVTAIFYVPFSAIRIAMAVPVTPEAIDWAPLFVASLLGLIVYAAAAGVNILIARDVYLGRPANFGEALRQTMPKLVPLLIASLIASLLTAIGMMLFIVPGLYAFARLFAVQPAVVIEGAGVGGSIERSSALTVGMKLHVLGAMLLALVISMAISLGAGLVSGMFNSRVVLFVVSTAVSVLIYPFFAIVQTLLYYDLRIRKEGFDIEYLAATAPDASAPTG